MSRVYKARDRHLDPFVAIKLLTETRLTDAGRRTNIITVHEIGEPDGKTFHRHGTGGWQAAE
jgi:hypothetical protein